MSNKNTMIKTKGLSKTFTMGGHEVKALSNVNLEIQKGEFVAIMGPSGSGKTTLLTLIGCLDKPTKGKVYLGKNGVDVTAIPDASLYSIRRKNQGFIFQSFNLIPSLSAVENVELPMESWLKSAKQRRKRARVLLKLVDILDREKHKPAQLSGGEQQRVSIARALANNPGIILADEPTGNLDSETGLSILNMLRKLATDYHRTVIIVTHDYNMAARADRQFMIRDGKLQEEAESKAAIKRVSEANN
jgi:putative ABC transport system ATP-binding protein